MSIETKPSNPKDVIGSKKLSLGLAPDTLMISAATAFLEGALKYGRYNWRVAGVRASIYHDACKRHLAKWWNGQDCDKATRVHHLDNAIACLAIMRDAIIFGKLEDDRPPCPDPDAIADHIDRQAEIVAHLQKMFEAHSPHQYTIADTNGVKDDTRRTSEGEDQAPIELIPAAPLLPHAGAERDGQPDPGLQRSGGESPFRHRGKGSWSEADLASVYDDRGSRSGGV